MNNSVLLLIARILLAVIFVLSGFGKLAAAEGTAGMIQGAGLPAPLVLAYLAGIFELVAGIALVVGFQTAIAAWLLAAFCIVSGFLFHFGATGDAMMDMMNQIMLLKNIAIAGGFLALIAAGPGAYSIDARRR